jgi:two-component system response regulator AtoC
MKSTSNVLIVDDSPSLAQSLCKILTMHEIKADAVFNAQDALQKIRRHRYELMLCDIEMPGYSGLELLERIRQDEEHDLDVILMTGHLEPKYFIRAIQLGAVDFISKPIEAQQLVGMISCHLKRRHSRETSNSSCSTWTPPIWSCS